MPALIANTVLPWERYWVPWNGRVHSGWDGSGFVTKPEGLFGRSHNPDLQLIDDILDRPFLVLSGQPGIGKTQEVEKLKQRWPKLVPGERLISLEARVLGSDFTSIHAATVGDPAWKAGLKRRGRIRLLIDGVDEATTRRVDLVSAMIQALRNQPMDRIGVILVCRAAEWDADQGVKFAELWNKAASKRIFKKSESDKSVRPARVISAETVWELCPLFEDDAKAAAQACGLDFKTFLREVRRLHVEALAARPITLKMLLEEYQVNHTFRLTYYELYQRSILRMCQEVNDDRANWVEPFPEKDQIYAAACRLAACLTIGRKSVIVKSDKNATGSATELLCSQILGEDAVGTMRLQVTSKLLACVLDTPLFSFRGPNYGFEQKTYAEFLAADYVKNCSVDQLRSIFCARIHDRELVAPHLAETAAWVAIANEPWGLYVCAQDPEILLRVDVSAMSPRVKSLALGNYLKKASREEAFDHQGLDKFYATFNHPELANQLRPYIVNAHYNPVARRIAIEIAGECRLQALESLLWQRARAGDPCIRYIASSLRRITGLYARKKLMAILQGKYPSSGFRDLAAMAIRVLVPRELAVKDVLTYLSKAARKESLDTYHTACNYYLVDHLKKSDVVASLQWLQQLPGPFDSLHSMYRFATRAFEEAIIHLDDTKIQKEVVALWIHCENSHLPHPSPIDSYEHLSAVEVEAKLGNWKLRLAKLIIESGRITKPADFHAMSDLVGANELDWLLSELKKAPQRTIPNWAAASAVNLNWDNAGVHRKAVLAAYRDCAQFRAYMPACEPGRDIVQTFNIFKRRWEKKVRQQQAATQRRHGNSLRRDDAIRKLVKVKWPAHRQWFRICDCICVVEKHEKRTTSNDLTNIKESFGWKAASSATRRGIKLCARQFLLKNKDTRRLANQATNVSRAAYFAIRLLFEDFKEDKKLAFAVRTRWSDAIFNPYMSDNPDHPKLVKWCYVFEPGRGLSAMRSRMKADDHTGLADNVLNSYLLVWDDRLRRVALNLLHGDTLKGRSIFRVLSWHVANDLLGARNAIAVAIQKQRFSAKDDKSRAFLLAALLLLPNEYGARSLAVLKRSSLGKVQKMFLELSWELGHGDRPLLSLLDDVHLKAFGLLLFRTFPPDKYPDRVPNGEVHSVTDLDRIAELRRSVLNILASRGTSSSSEAILRIAENAAPSARIWIKWQYNEALRSAAALLVPSRIPTEIVALVRSTNAALIDSADDLVSVVLNSLRRLQAKLDSKATEWRALWNESSPDGSRTSSISPKNEDALSDVVATWLTDDIGQKGQIVFNREVKIKRLEFTDIKIEAFTKGLSQRVEAIIESKRCNNRHIKTAVKSQLTDRYLIPMGIKNGIYLVGWYRGRWRPARGSVSWRPCNLKEAQSDVQSWASEVSTAQTHVVPFLLDCS